jgi:replicative DNA helicase
MTASSRSVPANVQAEKAILGAVLLDNSLFSAARTLQPDDFSLDSHRLIYLHILEMIDRGQAVDPVTLVEDMGANGTLKKVGLCPVAYICDLGADTIRYKPSVQEWVRIVKGKALLRRLIAVCSSAVNKAFDGERAGYIVGSMKSELEEIEAIAARIA